MKEFRLTSDDDPYSRFFAEVEEWKAKALTALTKILIISRNG